MITLNTMRKMWPRGNSRVPQLVEGIVAAAPSIFPKYGITTPLVVAHAMAQFSHECGAGTEMVENINYTAARAAQVWPSRFKSAEDCYSKVGSWAGDPDFPGKLIDSVYGSRMGNRPGTHDGRNFIGRGLAQTTGREGYDKLSKKVGVDFLDHPELVISPQYALEAGVADFVICGCLPFAENDDVDNVTLKLNGGHIGLAERKQWLARWKSALAAQGNAEMMEPPKVTPAAKTTTIVAAGTAASATVAAQSGAPPDAIIIGIVAIALALAIFFLVKKKG